MQPLDKGVDFRPLTAWQGRHVIMLMAFQRHVAKRRNQLAALQPLLHQPFTPHRYPHMIHRRNHR